jgi:hypothetical protein
MAQLWYYLYLCALRRQAVALRREEPSATPAEVHCQVVVRKRTGRSQERKKMRNDGPSSMAWMLIVLLVMGGVGLTVLGFMTLIATNLLVPGIDNAGTTFSAIP